MRSEVLSSLGANFKFIFFLQGWIAGDFFGASLPFTTVQVVTSEALAKTVMWKLTGRVTEATISHGVGVLGMPGATAYGGLIDVLRPAKQSAKPEVIWVSGAAGAVGGMVGQLAKQVYGCTVVGSCGGADKCALIKDKFGFDHAVDYKALDGGPTTQALTAALKSVAPDGIDMYFDNVRHSHPDNSQWHRDASCACVLRTQNWLTHL
jgi:NADPH:quinone reductase